MQLFRHLALIAILLHTASPVLASQQLSEQTVQQLMTRSGVTNAVNAVPGQMRAGLAQVKARVAQEAAQNPNHRVEPQQLADLERATARAYEPTALRATVAATISAKTTPQDAATVLAWLDSPLGKRVTQLELAASSTPTAWQQSIAQGMKLQGSLPADRLSRIRRLVAASRSVDVTATIIINSALGVARGVAAQVPSMGPSDISQLERDMNAQRPEIVRQLQIGVVAGAAQIYAQLSDRELDQYIAYLQSGAGARYQQSVYDGLTKALTDASITMGQSIAAGGGPRRGAGGS